MRTFWIILLILSAFSIGKTQDARLVNYNYTYVPYIKSVQFHKLGNELGFPIVRLQNGQPLRLAFDDMDGDVKDYTYSLVHCDRDWEPSNLNQMEYMDGFPNEYIREYNFSAKTLTLYTHYELVLPNDRVRWKVSGNYLLHVFNSERGDIPVITRRFVVVETEVVVDARFVVPNRVSKKNTHHEIDFVMDHQDLVIRNAQQEIFAAVLQNGRWDNAITDIQPLYTQGKSSVFDYQNRVIFPAGKEFRFLDLRSLRTRTQNIARIERFDDHFEVSLYEDLPRDQKVYLFRRDANGYFVVENFDYNLDGNTSSDYAEVTFVLKTGTPYEDKDVYLFGAFTEWLPKESHRLLWNPAINAYVGQCAIKQGYYDFAYATLDYTAEDPQPDFSETEGNWYEAENQYHILIYYRPFGSRFDRIIGLGEFNSNN